MASNRAAFASQDFRQGTREGFRGERFGGRGERFDRFRDRRNFGFFGVGIGVGYPYDYYGDYPYDYAYNDYYYDDGGCYVVQRRVATPYGWRIRPVQVCG